MNGKRWVAVLLAVALAGAAFGQPGVQFAAGVSERLANGSFEEGFYQTPAGYVGNGWQRFDNGGATAYGFYDDTWAPVVYHGAHSQLVEINTYKAGPPEPDRYAGIYQTVAVVSGKSYELSIHGMLRALEDDPDRGNYSYRVQYGVDQAGGTDWQAVSTWVEIPWDTVHPRLSPGPMDSYSTQITAAGKQLTLFVRAWKKWGTAGRELDVNLDSLSLKGAMPAAAAQRRASYSLVQMGDGQYSVSEAQAPGTEQPAVSFQVPVFPAAGWSYAIPVESRHSVGVTRLELYDNDLLLGEVDYDIGLLHLAQSFAWNPAEAGSHVLKAVAHDGAGAQGVAAVKVTVGKNAQFIRNGDFEQGYTRGVAGLVANEWEAFDNGGGAQYGFYDATWPPLVYSGQHSQMIEISSFVPTADADRYAGLCQTMRWMTKGATYKLTLSGMLRALADDSDRDGFNYRVEWGYLPNGNHDWKAVTNWVEIPWDTVYARTEPGEMSTYTATFVAPAKNVTLFLRVWKKWATTGRQLDVNLDAITVNGYK